MKPPSIEFVCRSNGTIGLRVSASSHACDKIYEAVNAAILEGIDPRRFMEEAREAWRYEMTEAAKHADSQWAKGGPR